MGANMMPMAKNRGRTVFGVRIGLHLSALSLSCLLETVNILPCFQSLLSKSSIYKSLSRCISNADSLLLLCDAPYSLAFYSWFSSSSGYSDLATRWNLRDPGPESSPSELI